MNLNIFNLSFAAYGAALAVFGFAYLAARPRRQRTAWWILAAAWLLQTVFLAMRWHESGHVPLSNQFESLAGMSWGLAALAGLFRRRENEAWLGPAAAALCLLLLGICVLLDRSIAPLVPALQSNWLLFHVAVIMMGYAALALSFLASVVYLAAYGTKAGHESAQAVDRFNERAMALGYLLLTGGIVLGAVWANEAWGSYWSWDPKETWSLITWLVYTAALHLRRTHRWEGRRMAWLSVAGFAFVLFTYFGVNYLLKSLHSYAGAR
ncbi:MAG: c-type cytochrome biogenesis protein CcsB [Elusimicrobiota bacterium]|jgi:cytochrome c-type biogenesis protein CcsB